MINLETGTWNCDKCIVVLHLLSLRTVNMLD